MTWTIFAIINIGIALCILITCFVDWFVNKEPFEKSWRPPILAAGGIILLMSVVLSGIETSKATSARRALTDLKEQGYNVLEADDENVTIQTRQGKVFVCPVGIINDRFVIKESAECEEQSVKTPKDFEK